MCTEPNKVTGPDGLARFVACRNCESCRRSRVDDLVGRCAAEARSADQTYFVTLTYSGGDENPHAHQLVYSDIQKMFKRLRKAPYNVRYMCVGEFGSKKGRAHWHLILFVRGRDFLIPLNERIRWKYWPHGFSHFEIPRYKAYRYCLKYALKEQSLAVSRATLMMSKKPILGYDFILDLAKKYVAQGLTPQSYQYTVPTEFNKDGELYEFYLQGKGREVFMDTFWAIWKWRYPDRIIDFPHSDILIEYLDGVARAEADRLSAEECAAVRDSVRRQYEQKRWLADRSTAGVVTKCVSSRRSGYLVLKSDAGYQLFITYHGVSKWLGNLLTYRQLLRAMRKGEIPKTHQPRS